MKVLEIMKILDADILVGENQLKKNITGGGGADLMEDVLAAALKSALLLTGVVSEQMIKTAITAGVGAVVFVRGKKPDEMILDLAFKNRLPVLLTRHTMFVSCGRLYVKGLRGPDGAW